ncbi:MAG: Ig-like domain-containing protein [Gemmatimonadota bacterium]
MNQPLLRLGVLGAMATAACSDAMAPNGTVATVVVAPATGSLLVGDTTRLVAAALDADGETLLNQVIEWATSDPSVATVSGSGLVTAVAAGSVTVYAASGIHADSAVLDVVEPLIASQIISGTFSTCSLDAQGVALCWGSNEYGELGINLVQGSIRRPTAVAGGLRWSSLVDGLHHTCGRTTGGSTYCWGWNYWGQVGDSTTVTKIQPTAVLGASVTSLALGSNNSCGIIVDGVRCWGSDWVSGFTGSPALQILTGGSSHLCGLVSGGQAFCWGGNFSGEVGDSTLTERTFPVPVAGGRSFTVLTSGGYSNCALVASGQAYCWGRNFTGQLGDGSSTDRLVPVPVAGGLSFKAISAGGYHSCGITTQGLAYCWGSGINGQLGDGERTSSTVPVAVAGGLRFSAISVGSSHTCGIATTGRTYCWGYNGYGQLGDGTYADRFIPVAVIAP